MTSGQQDRPEDESDDTGQQNEESQEGNFVPGSAADPDDGAGFGGDGCRRVLRAG